ncbi:MAG TPA: nitroreductase family deazaflavin-dependent oxidoreductase [Dehalococcoidia bacterium]|nr:nitroreductase family deazaflavin-dependent oxidoreductase [Dehalococcoidia bacterium]
MTIYHKPSGMTKLFNRIFGSIAGAGLMPKKNIMLETKGRKSGQTRSVPVTIVEYDGQRYLVSPRGESEWVRNVRADAGRATLRHGKRETVLLQELAPGERALIIQKYLRENAMATKQHFGIDPKSDISEFERIAPLHPVFRITTS